MGSTKTMPGWMTTNWFTAGHALTVSSAIQCSLLLLIRSKEMTMDNTSQSQAGTLLPFESIKADLIDAVVLELVEADKGHKINGKPKYWAVVSEEARQSQFFVDVLKSGYEQIQRHGLKASLGSIVLKTML